MRRRRYLRLSVAGAAVGVAGCSGRFPGVGSDSEFGSDPPDGSVSSGGTADLELPVARSEMDRGASKDAIPAITDPAFAEDWSGVSVETGGFTNREIEPRLDSDEEVIGVVRDGRARAYPLRILNWHEIVNDTFGGPLLVTYCPLCGSAVTAVRTVDGEVTNFGVSGLLWRQDLVMYDEATESLWSQIVATAINGDRTGEKLQLVPSTLTTLGRWRGDYPDTAVLRPPPESGTIGDGPGVRDYTKNPYDVYESSGRIGLGREGFEDDRLHPKTEVIGIANGDTARAYPAETVREAGLINDEVGKLPVVVTVADETPVAYVRRSDGTTLSFSPDDDRHIAADGSRWRRASGLAVDGPHEGRRLEQANEVSPLFWFAWLDFHPDSELYET